MSSIAAGASRLWFQSHDCKHARNRYFNRIWKVKLYQERSKVFVPFNIHDLQFGLFRRQSSQNVCETKAYFLFIPQITFLSFYHKLAIISSVLQIRWPDFQNAELSYYRKNKAYKNSIKPSKFDNFSLDFTLVLRTFSDFDILKLIT